ncbi:YtxH domain-containing protein [Neobacillus vireti]|uniref:YtxH domain-containing protein n=1 Tax=Neobacillus vireti TaxID=220686 RepID=UPI002FFD9FB7
MEPTKNQDNQSQESKNEHGSNGSPIKRSLAGGLIGVTVGYLTTPENGKKLMQVVSSDKLKSTGSGIGQAVKEKSKKAIGSIKNSAGKLFNKNEDVSIEGYSNEQDETAGNETMIKPAIKKKSEKNHEESSNKEDLNKRLDQLEEMLAELVKEKQGQKTAV